MDARSSNPDYSGDPKIGPVPGEVSPGPRLGATGEETEVLVRRAGEDPRCFTELYARIAPAVYAWVRLRLGSSARERLDPEDVVQEVWLRAAKAFTQFDPQRGSFRGWIFQVTKYTLLDTFRRLAAGEPAAVQGASKSGVRRGGFDLSQVPDEVTSFTRRIAREEGLQSLFEELEALPEEERELLVICGLEGRPASEAALQLGLGHEAVRKRWLRLRQRMAQRAELAALID